VGVPEDPAAGNAARYLTRPHIAALKRSGSVSGQPAATALLCPHSCAIPSRLSRRIKEKQHCIERRRETARKREGEKK